MTLRAAVAGLVKHQLMWLDSGGVSVTTIWTHRAVTANLAVRVADERAILRTWCTNQWRPQATVSSRLQVIKTWDMSVVPPVKLADDPGDIIGNLAGAGSGALPSFCTAVVALRTQAVGASTRGVNGRIAHVGLDKQQYTNDDLNAGTRTALIAVYDNLRTTLKEGVGGTAQGTWCIVSYQHGGTRAAPVYRGAPLVLAVNHILMTSRLGVQRRRRVRQQSFALGT